MDHTAAGTKRAFEDGEGTGENKQGKHDPSVDLSACMVCELPPLCSHNPHRFQSYEMFEAHYQKFHSNTCATCGKIFPSERFLEIHITENHDPFASLRQERGEKIVRTESTRSDLC